MMMGGGFFGILLIGLVVFLVIRLFDNSNAHNFNGSSYHRNSDAIETLKERYARGEISEEEYMKKRKILND